MTNKGTMENASEATPGLNLKIRTDNILFFDMDGTLVNTNFANYLSYKKAIQFVMQSDINIPYSPNQRFSRVMLRSIIPNLTESEYERIIQKKEQCYNEYLYQTKLNRLIADILLQYSRTHKTVLVTNCRKGRVFMTLDYYGLVDKFSYIFHRQTNNTKNRMNKYENAISYLNIPANSVIVFEDEESEINNAILAGIPIHNIVSI